MLSPKEHLALKVPRSLLPQEKPPSASSGVLMFNHKDAPISGDLPRRVMRFTGPEGMLPMAVAVLPGRKPPKNRKENTPR